MASGFSLFSAAYACYFNKLQDGVIVTGHGVNGVYSVLRCSRGESRAEKCSDGPENMSIKGVNEATIRNVLKHYTDSGRSLELYSYLYNSFSWYGEYQGCLLDGVIEVNIFYLRCSRNPLR